MPDKFTLQGGSATGSGHLFDEHSPIPLIDNDENPWGAPGESQSRPSTAMTPPSPSPPASPSPPRSIRKERPPSQPQPPSDVVEDVRPPMYSGPSNPPPQTMLNAQSLQSLVPGLPPISFGAYTPPGCFQSSDFVSIKITNPKWASSLDSFTKAIYEQIALPPRAEVRILGEEGNQMYGFNIRLNTTRYFLPRDGESGLSYVKARPLPGRSQSPMAAEVGLQECLQAFWRDPTLPKSFTVTRELSNWDTDFLVGRIHALIASTDYQYRVRVLFPRHFARFTVTIQDDGHRSLASTILSAFKSSKDYGVQVVWPYADAPRFDGDGDADAPVVGRKCLIRSEEGWWSDWRPVVKEAIKAKRQGWVGLDDWMDMAMRPRPVERGGG